MAKKYNRSRPQKRNVDPDKLEKDRTEAARELSVEVPDKRGRKGPSVDINLQQERDR